MATNDNPYLDSTQELSPTSMAPPTTTDPGVLPSPTGEPRAPLDPEGVLYDVPSSALGNLEEARPPGSTTGQYVTPESTVSGQLLDLLGKDSPYLREADTRAREESNRMGLLGSSMAVGAAERERIKAALPIAQQDAQLYGTSALKEQEFAGTSALETQRAASESALARQGHVENVEALGVQADHQMRLEAYSQDAATQRSQMEMEFKADIANVEMDAETRQQYLASSAELGIQFNSDIGAILRSKDFASETDRDIALSQIGQVYENNLKFLSSAAGVSLDWTASGGTNTTPDDGVIPAPPTTIPNIFSTEPSTLVSDTDYYSGITGTVPSGGGIGVDYPKLKSELESAGAFESPSYLEFFNSNKMVERDPELTKKLYTDIMGGVLNPNNPELVKLANQSLHLENFGSSYSGSDFFSIVDNPTSLFQQYINNNL